MRAFSGSGNYPYACARVKARGAFLIKRDEYLRLVNMSLGEVSEFIGHSQYRQEVESLASSFSGADLVERATYGNLAATYRKVLGFCQGELRDIVLGYVRRIDIWNLKTILRAASHRAPREDILRETIPGGVLALDALIEAAQHGMGEVVEALKGTEFHAPLREVLDGRRGADLMELENCLDQTYYANLHTGVVQHDKAHFFFKEYVHREIDVVNLMTLLKLKREELHGRELPPDPQRFALKGGKELGDKRFAELASMSPTRFLEALRELKFYDEIEEGAQAIEAVGEVGPIIRACERYLMRQSAKLSHLHPLSSLPVLHYLMAKKREVDNLRIISRGKQSGLERDEIMSLLVI